MWLLESSIRSILEVAQASGGITAEHQLEYCARHGEDSAGSPRLLTLAGSSARISIVGVMTDTPSFMAYYYGGGNPTYGDITDAVSRIAENGPPRAWYMAFGVS